MLSCLVDKKEKVQKQAQKSLCILMQNRQIEILIRPLATIQQFVTSTFNQQLQMGNGKGAASQQVTKNTTMVLNFLAAALQLMPLSLCADLAIKILRLAQNVEDS